MGCPGNEIGPEGQLGLAEKRNSLPSAQSSEMGILSGRSIPWLLAPQAETEAGPHVVRWPGRDPSGGRFGLRESQTFLVARPSALATP